MDRDTIADLFAVFGPVGVRRMFSGFGLYADDICFALCLRGEFYFKADAGTIPRFESEGCTPFSYATRQKTVTVNSFWRMPERLYDDPDELADWARAAVAAARRVKGAKTRSAKPVPAKPRGSKMESRPRRRKSQAT